MNIYEFAMQMEREGEKYYRELAEKTSRPGLIKIFSMLADDEVKHYNVIEKLSRKEKLDDNEKMGILDDVKSVFVEMKEEKQGDPFETSDADHYRKARDFEEKSMNFYNQKADEVESKAEQGVFLKLAKEESKHFRLLENIVEFVSRPDPGRWLENSEWHHMDEY